TQRNFRKWYDTIERTHELWDIALKDTKTAYKNVSKDYGIQDNINDVFKEGIIFNPFLRLKVEVLHAFMLGAIKYMIRDFMCSLKPKNLSQLIASCESFNPDALDLAHISGKYFVKHFKSLVGKHFKM
ncbi:hypothetical protein VP01_11305g1, partial [Puccinia sorghi]